MLVCHVRRYIFIYAVLVHTACIFLTIYAMSNRKLCPNCAKMRGAGGFLKKKTKISNETNHDLILQQKIQRPTVATHKIWPSQKYPLWFVPFCDNRYKRMQNEWSFQNQSKNVNQSVLLVMAVLELNGFDGFGKYTGDIMQWCDIAAALIVSGAQVDVYGGSNYKSRLPNTLKPDWSLESYDIIFIDYVGLQLFVRMFTAAGREHELQISSCKFRVVDTFGTERSFLQNQDRVFHPLIPRNITLEEKQILTFEPHHIEAGNYHQDNTFLGYTAPAPVRPTRRRPIWRGLLWGKTAEYFRSIMPALNILCEHIPLSTTSEGLELPRTCLQSVGILPVNKYLDFVRNHVVFIGSGEPAMGPGAVEAVAMGLFFMNPKHDPPWTVNYGSAIHASHPLLHGKPTRTIFHYQNTILGDDRSHAAQTYVHNVNMHNLSDVKRVISQIKTLYHTMNDTLTGYLTPQASVGAFSDRLRNILTVRFCS